jgi:hypothetical protein
METLKAMTAKLGAPKLEGNEAVGGKDAPALYFGTTKRRCSGRAGARIEAYYGEVPILGTPYITGYEPIQDSSGAEIGVYYVGYKSPDARHQHERCYKASSSQNADDSRFICVISCEWRANIQKSGAFCTRVHSRRYFACLPIGGSSCPSVNGEFGKSPVLLAALRGKWSHLSWIELFHAHFIGSANDFVVAARRHLLI